MADALRARLLTGAKTILAPLSRRARIEIPFSSEGIAGHTTPQSEKPVVPVVLQPPFLAQQLCT